MSRIGKKPIPIPKGVTVKIAPDAIEVQGPKGKLRQIVPPGILFAQDDGALVARLEREEPALKKFHGRCSPTRARPPSPSTSRRTLS